MVVLLVELDVVGDDLAVAVLGLGRLPGDADGVGRLEVEGEVRRGARGRALLAEPVAHLLLAVADLVLAAHPELVVHPSLHCNSIQDVFLRLFRILNSGRSIGRTIF